MSNIALLDADIFSMRCAFSAENDEEEWVATSRADNMVEQVLSDLGCTEYELWLSGKNNFRYKVFPEYKRKRIDQQRPRHEQAVKQHFIENWQANVSDGCEADDMLGVRQMMYNEQDGLVPIIVSLDKDLDMIPGWHYNFVKMEKYHVSNEEAMYNFQYQMLVGDSTDNIPGVSRYGPIKAKRLLDSINSEQERFLAIRELYSCDEEMLMNGQCLWIWRKMDDIWKLPECLSGQKLE